MQEYLAIHLTSLNTPPPSFFDNRQGHNDCPLVRLPGHSSGGKPRHCGREPTQHSAPTGFQTLSPKSLFSEGSPNLKGKRWLVSGTWQSCQSESTQTRTMGQLSTDIFHLLTNFSTACRSFWRPQKEATQKVGSFFRVGCF